MNIKKVLNYCIQELKIDPSEAKRLSEKVSKYEDIYLGFMNWLDSREFTDGIRIENYSSEQIHTLAPNLSGMGVYNFMVTLRDNPELAKKIIRSGFKVQ